MTPYLYQTNDYGKTWKRIADGTNGIPATYFTRVVREDTARKGLLYAGTEFGLFISLDDGARWQPLQLQSADHAGDGLARVSRQPDRHDTGARILRAREPRDPADDPSRHPTGERDSVQAGRRLSHRRPVAPKFDYWFKDAPTSPVTVTVSDAKGNVVFTVTTQPGARRRRGCAGGAVLRRRLVAVVAAVVDAADAAGRADPDPAARRRPCRA